MIKREVFERGNAVAVLIHDPATDQILLVEQFRIGAIRDQNGPWMMEVVAGIVESGESNSEVARREAMEEAGCKITDLEHIIDFYPSPGGSTELISLYYAPADLSTVQTGIHGLDHEDEDIRVSVEPRNTVMKWLATGKLKSAIGIIAMQWLELNKPSG